jgi:tetratricopeptide (TPR) repeat protein
MSSLGREQSDCMIIPRPRVFLGRDCYRSLPMGAKPAKSRLTAQLVLLPVILFTLAACATPGAPGTAGEDKPLYPGPQSNVASLSEVIAAHPDDPQAYNMRGSVYGEAGRPEQALADFTKAISLDPNYAHAYANRALVYRRLNKLDQALADDNKALAIDPSYASAYIGRGIVYREQGRHSQALEDFNKAIGLQPENADYERLGQKDKAAGSYAKALNVNDKYQPAKEGFTRVGSKVGQTYPTF